MRRGEGDFKEMINKAIKNIIIWSNDGEFGIPGIFNQEILYFLGVNKVVLGLFV